MGTAQHTRLHACLSTLNMCVTHWHCIVKQEARASNIRGNVQQKRCLCFVHVVFRRAQKQHCLVADNRVAARQLLLLVELLAKLPLHCCLCLCCCYIQPSPLLQPLLLPACCLSVCALQQWSCAPRTPFCAARRKACTSSAPSRMLPDLGGAQPIIQQESESRVHRNSSKVKL